MNSHEKRPPPIKLQRATVKVLTAESMRRVRGGVELECDSNSREQAYSCEAAFGCTDPPDRPF